jgi:cell division control protein 45
MAYTLLSKQLRHENVGDLLWLACIGVTDAYLHNRLDLFGYIQLAVDLENHVERVYPDMNLDDENQLLVTRSANAFYAEDVLDTSSNANGNAPRTRVGFSENGRIVTHKNEFRFFLLRHSSLWESIRLSPDASTKMGLWKPSGIQKLQEMLAKMGLPLTQCRQPYAFMKPSFKRRLREMLLDHAEVSKK